MLIIQKIHLTVTLSLLLLFKTKNSVHCWTIELEDNMSSDKKEEKEVSGARGGLFGAGGRFKGGTDPIMEKFNESISFDKR